MYYRQLHFIAEGGGAHRDVTDLRQGMVAKQ